MKEYKTYVTKRRAKGKAICGDVNLPRGTQCTCKEGFIQIGDQILCATSSQNAYDYFAHNDDGHGLQRGTLIAEIMAILRKHKERWDKVWDDERCRKYKRPEHGDHWLWNYDFYHAPIEDLEYMRKLVQD